MSLLITGNKSKIKYNEIASINIEQVQGLSSNFQTYIDPLQSQNITNLIWNINTINNQIWNLTNSLNNNNDNDNNQSTQLNNINNLIININTWITNIENNKSNISYVDQQINNINTSINLINNDINDILTKNINYDNKIITYDNYNINNDNIINNINNWLNEKVNNTTYNNELTNIQNNHNNQQTQINNINLWLWNLGNSDIITNDQLNTLNTQINYLTPITNTSQTKINNIETITIPNINNNITSLTNNLTNNYYNKTNVDNNILVVSNNLTNNYYNKTNIDTQLTNYYNKNNIDTQLTNYYNKWSIDTQINNINTVLNSNDENNVLYVDFILGNDNNNGRNIKWKLKTIEKAFDIATGSTTIKILGSNTYNINNYSLAWTKTSIKIIINEGALINGTLNLVQGNTAIQFYGGKLTFTLNDNSAGTTYFKNCDLDSSTFNFTNGGYKTIENSTFNLTLLNLSSTVYNISNNLAISCL